MNQPDQQLTAFGSIAPGNTSLTAVSRLAERRHAERERSSRAVEPDESAVRASERCVDDVRRWIDRRMSDVTVV